MLEGGGLSCDQLGAEQVITPVQRSGRLSNTPKRTNKHKEKSSLKQNIETCPAGLQCLMRRCKMFRSFMLCAAQRREAGGSMILRSFKKSSEDMLGEGPGPRSCLSCSDQHPVRVEVRTKRLFSAKKICFSLCSLYFHVSKADGCETSVCSSALAAAP